MLSILTTPQTALLRRIANGDELPAWLFRPPGCADDIEVLCSHGLLLRKAGRLAITAEGAQRLRREDVQGVDSAFDNIRIVHGRDQSITVEYRASPTRP